MFSVVTAAKCVTRDFRSPTKMSCEFVSDSNKVYLVFWGKNGTHKFTQRKQNIQRHTKCPLQFISIQFKYVYISLLKFLGIHHHHHHSQSYTNSTILLTILM